MAAPPAGPQSASKAAPELPFHEVAAGAVSVAQSSDEELVSAQEHARGVNFRDLHSVSPTAIQPGRVYRSSQVVSAQELERLGVSSVLDLRQPPVGCKTNERNMAQALRDAAGNVLGWVAGLAGAHRYGRMLAWAHAPAGQPAPRPCYRCSQETCQYYGIKARVFHVDLLPTHVSLRILWRLPRSLQARVLWAAARRRHPEPIVAGAVADPEVMGYLQLYVLLLERAQGRLAAALRLFADPANFPLLVHCIHGKDRTGLVAMLLLLVCEVDREAVVRDYALSEALLRESREKRRLLGLEEHLTTDQILAAAAHVMGATIDHVECRYGSAHNYLKALGLTNGELALIVGNLTRPGLEMPATAATATCATAG